MESFWSIANIMALAEIFLIGPLILLKTYTETKFGHELTMKYAEGINFSGIQEILFLFIAILSIFLAWLADGYIGKCFISLFGIIFVVVASLLWTNDIYDIIQVRSITHIFVIMYISTSTIRNVMLLEQLRIPKDAKKVRHYIFSLIMTRTVVLFACNSLIVFNYGNMKIICIIGVVSVILYSLLFIFLGDKIKMEATYYRIWFLCFKCFALALTRKREHDKAVTRTRSKLEAHSSESQKRVKFDTVDVIEYSKHDSGPAETTKRWGFRIIISEKSPTPEKIIVEEPPPAETYLQWLLSFLPFSTHYTTATEQKVLPEVKEKIEKEKHWIYSAVPKVTIYVARQTRIMFSIIFVVIPASLIGQLMYFVLITSSKQVPYLTKKFQFVDWGTIDLITFSLIFDIILFPIYEILNSFFDKKPASLTYLIVGYGITMIALIASFTVQLKLETTLQYLPNENVAVVRFFNSLQTTTSVSSSSFGFHRIQRTEYILISIFGKGVNKVKVRFVNDEAEVDINLVLVLKSHKCVSYVITQEEIIQNSNGYDPTVFSPETTRGYSYFFIVDGYSFLYERRKYFFQDIHDKNVTFLFDYEKGKKFVIPSGIYYIVLKMINGEAIVETEADLQESCLYILFSYHTRKVIHAKLFLAEGPLSLSLERLLAQILLISLANAVTSVSFYKFLYIESPQKLRSAVFTAIFALNTLGLSLVKLVVSMEEQMKYSKVILVYGLTHVFFFMLTMYFSSQYEHNYPDC